MNFQTKDPEKDMKNETNFIAFGFSCSRLSRRSKQFTNRFVRGHLTIFRFSIIEEKYVETIGIVLYRIDPVMIENVTLDYLHNLTPFMRTMRGHIITIAPGFQTGAQL